ncbi:hypothetical protein SHIRM173S_09874 [Streptomyces hirsutus]
MLVDFDDPLIAHATGAELTRLLVAEGLVPNCAPRTPWEGGGQVDIPAQSIAASWALGDHQFKPLQTPDSYAYSQREQADADIVWQRLMALSPAEQRSRMAEVHAAALSCTEYTEVLAGKASQ